MATNGWLLLLYELPTKHGSQRVSLWRRLKKMGALPLKTSAYLLPDLPALHERFQWLAKQIKDDGGTASLIRASEIEGVSHRQILVQFNDARAAEYDEIIRALTERLRSARKSAPDTLATEVERLRGRVAEIQQVDFFDSPRAHDALMLLQKAEGLRRTEKQPPRALQRSDYQGKTWLTRPQPHIDRVGSAWLIKTFIDPKARFVFGTQAEHPGAIPFDMADVEFTHQGEDCTFETLLKRFGLREKTLQKIAEMVHDADLDDQKFRTPGADGIDRVLKGLGRLGWTDEKILQHGFICFEALHAQVKGS
ncbi:MAG TPA: chromate resistance protein ChrB domain-containing protein [Candidatus Didemnitutus sp.]|nr:chromate resistance protein ChrB domain-containing protein [Candidatus Didemnitutus sp.]